MILSSDFYKDFPKATNSFSEEPRDFCYNLALEQLDKAKKEDGENWYFNENTVNGILLLLLTWNYAYPKTKKLKREEVRQLLLSQSNNLKPLEDFSILDNWEHESDWIRNIFEEFKKIVGQTGASKALSLLNPKLFVMWDTTIRESLTNRKTHEKVRIDELGNGEDPESYIRFMTGIKGNIKRHDLLKEIQDKNQIAKKIDEYHYVMLIMNKEK